MKFQTVLLAMTMLVAGCTGKRKGDHKTSGPAGSGAGASSASAGEFYANAKPLTADTPADSTGAAVPLALTFTTNAKTSGAGLNLTDVPAEATESHDASADMGMPPNAGSLSEGGGAAIQEAVQEGNTAFAGATADEPQIAVSMIDQLIEDTPGALTGAAATAPSADGGHAVKLSNGMTITKALLGVGGIRLRTQPVPPPDEQEFMQKVMDFKQQEAGVPPPFFSQFAGLLPEKPDAIPGMGPRVDAHGEESAAMLVLSGDDVAPEMLRSKFDKSARQAFASAQSALNHEAGLDPNIKIKGPYMIDLLTGKSTPEMEAPSIPDGTYRRLSLQLVRYFSETPSPLNGHVMYIEGYFMDPKDGKITIAIVSDTPRHLVLRGKDGFKLANGTNALSLAFNMEKWLANLPFDGIRKRGSGHKVARAMGHFAAIQGLVPPPPPVTMTGAAAMALTEGLEAAAASGNLGPGMADKGHEIAEKARERAEKKGPGARAMLRAMSAGDKDALHQKFAAFGKDFKDDDMKRSHNIMESFGRFKLGMGIDPNVDIVINETFGDKMLREFLAEVVRNLQSAIALQNGAAATDVAADASMAQ